KESSPSYKKCYPSVRTSVTDLSGLYTVQPLGSAVRTTNCPFGTAHSLGASAGGPPARPSPVAVPSRAAGWRIAAVARENAFPACDRRFHRLDTVLRPAPPAERTALGTSHCGA